VCTTSADVGPGPRPSWRFSPLRNVKRQVVGSIAYPLFRQDTDELLGVVVVAAEAAVGVAPDANRPARGRLPIRVVRVSSASVRRDGHDLRLLRGGVRSGAVATSAASKGPNTRRRQLSFRSVIVRHSVVCETATRRPQ